MTGVTLDISYIGLLFHEIDRKWSRYTTFLESGDDVRQVVANADFHDVFLLFCRPLAV